ncbi:DUF2909 domain-containing protein [Chromatiaceae bacterium AAb-1]|jgi:hypothetical protein|nr:DUF2909 domain-containing protein [Chromatiaceae bacterium AAb-1]
MLLIKLILIALLMFIIFNLFRAGVIMLRNNPADIKMSRFLGRRLILSVIVMLIIVLALATGVISQHPRPY